MLDPETLPLKMRGMTGRERASMRLSDPIVPARRTDHAYDETAISMQSWSAGHPLDPQSRGLLIEIFLVSPFDDAVQSEGYLMFLIRHLLNLHVDVGDHFVHFLPFSGVVDDGVPFQGITQLRDDFVQVALSSRQVLESSFERARLVRSF